MSEDGVEGCGIDLACYSLEAEYGRHVPYIRCTCGWRGRGATWAEVGQDYDDHLEDTGGDRE